MNEEVATGLPPDGGGFVAGADGGEGGAAVEAMASGSAALRSPVRMRSVARGSAALPSESARRRACEALRPLNEFKGIADM